MYQDSEGAWRWALFSSDSKIVTQSGAGFDHERACMHDMETIIPPDQNPHVFKVAAAGSMPRVSVLRAN